MVETRNSYLIKKIGILLLSLCIVATMTFFLMHAIPGDPFMQEQVIPEEILISLHKHYGLDQPLYIQFGKYIHQLLHFNLGPSFKYEGRSVNAIIGEGFPVSFCLGVEALILAVSGGIFLGSIASLNRLRWQDHLSMVIAIVGISVPSFVLASFLQYCFAIKLDLLPVARWGTFSQSIMPAISLAALPMAFISRLTRTNMTEVMQQDYIQTAKSKGLNPFQIVLRHMLRNALIPVIAYLGSLAAAILTGSFAIEKIFGIPGLGQWFVTSIINRDYTVITGITLFYSAILMLSVLLADLVSCLMDPTIEWKKEEYG